MTLRAICHQHVTQRKPQRTTCKGQHELLHYFSLLVAQILAAALTAFNSRHSVSGTAVSTDLHVQPVLLRNSLLKRISNRHYVFNPQTVTSHTPHRQITFSMGARLHFLNSLAKSLATSPGFSATSTPAFLKASILLAAVPLLPIIMAPACPIRLPGGAVRPATNAATGLE